MDATRRLGRLATEAVGDAARSTARALRAALALEAVGVAQRALDWGVEHAKERQQFGKSIGVYQAVSHSLVDALHGDRAVALARLLGGVVRRRGRRAGAGRRPRRRRRTRPKRRCPACERSIQVHGGIGFTWEHPLHRYYKRAQWIQAFDGFPARSGRRSRLRSSPEPSAS